MCGIIGIVSKHNVTDMLFEGLKTLEYRGYDSAGIAVIDNHEIKLHRSVGHISDLINKCVDFDISGNIGIAHTRWATHGAITENNAHPHQFKELAIVHNGIIENYRSLKSNLVLKGHVFVTDTDTEVLLHLIYSCFTDNILEAWIEAKKHVVGSYSIALINTKHPNYILASCLNAPMIFASDENSKYCASDVSAISTNQYINLQDGDTVYFSDNEYKIINNNCIVNREVIISGKSVIAEQNTSHQMYNEIYEQSITIKQLLYKSYTAINNSIQFIACGSSYHACLVAQYWFEEYLNVSVDIASEFRYRQKKLNNTTIICVSQSGETADTIAALKYSMNKSNHTIAITNSNDNTLTRLSNETILIHAGYETSVAATKSFTHQLIVLLKLCYNNIDISLLPSYIENILSLDEEIKSLAMKLKNYQSILFIGRNTMLPIAMEGALKLKEVSYIHAEAYPAGELKHGALALINKNMPVIVLAPSNHLSDKIRSTIQQLSARGAVIYLFTDTKDNELMSMCDTTVLLPINNIPLYFLPILYAIPLQLLAYHTGTLLGYNVDRPRNLAKSVTVE